MDIEIDIQGLSPKHIFSQASTHRYASDLVDDDRLRVVIPSPIDQETLERMDLGEMTPAKWLANAEDEQSEWAASMRPAMDALWPTSLPYPEEAEGGGSAKRMLWLAPACVLLYERDEDRFWIGMTGGGMNLSWDIAGAYIACEMIPPIELLRSLPRFAGENMKSSPNRAPVVASFARAQYHLANAVDQLAYSEKMIREWLS
jgi:hypothetical protein